MLRRTLAERAVEIAGKRPELVERTLQRLLAEECRKQENRESVARAAIEELAETKPDAATEQSDAVDEDWLNAFVRYAENVSSEHAQRMWGRILAGELGRAGSFSLVTLRTLAEMDQDTATAFQDVYGASIGRIIPKSRIGIRGRLHESARRMEEAGLISGYSGTVSAYILPDETAMKKGEKRNIGFIRGNTVYLRFYGKHKRIFQNKIEALYFSKVGAELSRILAPHDEAAVANRFIMDLDVANQLGDFESIELWRLDASGTQLDELLRVRTIPPDE